MGGGRGAPCETNDGGAAAEAEGLVAVFEGSRWGEHAAEGGMFEAQAPPSCSGCTRTASGGAPTPDTAVGGGTVMATPAGKSPVNVLVGDAACPALAAGGVSCSPPSLD